MLGEHFFPGIPDLSEQSDDCINGLFFFLEVSLIELRRIEPIEPKYLVGKFASFIQAKRSLQLAENILSLDQIIANRLVSLLQILYLKASLGIAHGI